MCGGTGELAGKLFYLSHFHDSSMFGLFLIGARIARVVALVCIDVSCHQSSCVGLDEIVGIYNEYKWI